MTCEHLKPGNLLLPGVAALKARRFVPVLRDAPQDDVSDLPRQQWLTTEMAKSMVICLRGLRRDIRYGKDAVRVVARQSADS